MEIYLKDEHIHLNIVLYGIMEQVIAPCNDLACIMGSKQKVKRYKGT